MKQRTLGRAVSFEGVALHTGTVCKVTLRPAPVDHGVVFRRVDLGQDALIPARARFVSRTDRCTTLCCGSAQVSTVEHLLAALRGLEIDNVIIDIDGPEVPIADGSAASFVAEIDAAGIVEQPAERRLLKVKEPVWARVGGSVAVALPYDGFKVSLTFTNDHGHPVLGDLFAEIELTPDEFRSGVASARTIGWLDEIDALKARGLVKGASMEMAVVLSETEILTPMRFPNEPARHKVLDIIGDLFLAGFVHAHIVAVRASHALNAKLAQALAARGATVEMSQL